MIKLLKVFILIIIFQVEVFAEDKVFIIKKINKEIITNLDVMREYQYLQLLNKEFIKFNKNEALKIAEKSLTQEKIKKNEINKFFKIEDFKDDKLIDLYFNNLIKKIGLENEYQFNNYMARFDISKEDIREKIKIEILWNQLILAKYKTKVTIDEKKILERIKEQKKKQGNIVEYDLYEIVFQVKNLDELNNKYENIKNDIKDIGIQNTAIKHSIAETAKLGGYTGKIEENRLSKRIKDQLNSLKIGEYTDPINIGGNFLVLFVNDKQILKNKINEQEMLKNITQFETEKQLNVFSQIYFNKIKLQSNINE